MPTVPSDPVETVWAAADLMTAMCVRVAATLRVADHVASGCSTSHELARATGACEGPLDRVLRQLARRGFFAHSADRYALTPLGEVLRDGHPAGLRATLDLEGPVGRGDTAFVRLLDAVRTGAAVFAYQHSRTFWDDLAADPARRRTFDAEMGEQIEADASEIVDALDWGAFGRVVDVGGGDATLLTRILRRYRSLKGVVVDLPEAAAAARRRAAALDLSDRLEVVAGSAFEPLPPAAGAYVLSDVLHLFGDDDAVVVLRRCAQAAGARGSVLVIERMGPDGEPPYSGMDLRLLVYCGGKERGVTALRSLGEQVGLHVAGDWPAGTRTVLELCRPPS